MARSVNTMCAWSASVRVSARGHGGEACRLRRVIALVGNAHQPSSQAECEHDLGRAGQERADA
jgi:hypothetical protein